MSTPTCVCKYTDPTEEAREDLTLEEAIQAVRREDPGLLYLRPDRLYRLREDAALAGDDEQVRLCNLALIGDHQSMIACVEVILDSAGQE